MSQKKLLKRITRLTVNGKHVLVPPSSKVYASKKHYYVVDEDTTEKKFSISWVSSLHKANVYDESFQDIVLHIPPKRI